MQDAHLKRLTKIPWFLRWAAAIDQTPPIGWLLGTVGMIWLPVVVGAVISVLLSNEVAYPSICWVGGSLVLLQVISGLVSHGAKLNREFRSGVSELASLLEFLDWMHAQVFTKNTATRITLMVPVAGQKGRVLRTFLRPSAFSPLESKTELAIDCNRAQVEGIAGKCFSEGVECRVELDIDPDRDPSALEEYAERSYIPTEKAKALSRKARYYLALPIENSTGPHLGVLIVDNACHPRIVESSVKEDSKRAEAHTRFLVQWIALRMRAIPARIRERA